MSVSDDTAALLRTASLQHGLFTREQAYAAGWNRQRLWRAVRSGLVEPVSRCVFKATGSVATWEQRVLGAVWSGGPSCLATGATASMLRGTMPVDVDAPIEVLIDDRDRNFSFPGVVTHSTFVLLDADRSTVNGIPCTDPIRTWLMLAARLPVAELEHLLDASERDGVIVRSELLARVDALRGSGRNGIGVARKLLEEREAVRNLPQSVLERRFLRLLQSAGIRGAVPQYRIERADGRLAFIDFAWPALRCGVELDGHVAHATRAQRAADNVRQRELSAVGFDLLRFTWEEVHRQPEQVLASVRRLLRGRADPPLRLSS